ncbi:MAG: hypothetical protein A2231_11500 [Candidatus Firestonebacteria bacterium RIFOXYA2_FULL_40_8]|nr:MAG: hypothetical protein A2231_11500 [Candidatus Firestonebacteria bacterium RIFOXYA2_FULL_40_8]
MAFKNFKRKEWRALWDLYGEYLQVYVPQQKNFIKGSLLASMKAFYDYYHMVPDEEDLEACKTDDALRFNAFTHITLERMQKYMLENGMPDEDFEIVKKADGSEVVEAPRA